MFESVRGILAPKWSLEILGLLDTEGPLNFSEIEEEIDTSPDVLTERLQLLAENDLIERVERSARDVSYSIRDEGSEVMKHVSAVESILSSRS